MDADVTTALPALSDGRELEQVGLGGGLEGADRIDRETALWFASKLSPDRIINTVKDTADARGRDSVRNNGYINGASMLFKDGIVGSHYRLKAKPNWRFLSTYNAGFTVDWAKEFGEAMEARFGLLAESESCWLDAERVNTFTGMVRLAVGVFMATGEVIGTAEWIREKDRPYNTAIQMIRTDRLCNPNGQSDTIELRRGVKRDARGKPISYFIRNTDSQLLNYVGEGPTQWIEVPAAKPWGRKQVIHIIEQQDHGQSRGVADIVSVLKSLRMTKRFSEVVLQSAVVNATYAASIESELPGDAIAAAMGGTTASDPTSGFLGLYNAYLKSLGAYLGGSNNIGIDGAVIPHLFPGTKMKLQNAGTPGGIGTGFEQSLLRHIAAGLGVSYEALSRDYSQTNYSSGKLGMNQMERSMSAKKRHVADRYASDIYALQLEEMMAAGDVPLPPRVKRDLFYAKLAKEAFCNCSWIGNAGGQVDELKETQAAGLRVQMGLSSLSRECARLGYDWRDVRDERQEEAQSYEEAGITLNFSTIKPNGTNDDPESPDSGTGTGGGGNSGGNNQ